ncbi:hypothetical protein PR202_gb17790 [Eleusine coracana subsp. coracana]|uniref:Uncharacterized protein n=1 Tax=Eleusine coracana subsp. coracana TaxID=191504 RepID=A0AAV5F4I0_ELECO|nr:hypothetical protein PR202_gb17790 [Eleusine coracana subsp. coracana]
MMMELELGLALPDPGPNAACGELGVRLDGKRGFRDAFDSASKKPQGTLPLFVRGDEDGGGERRRDGGGDCDMMTNK